MKRGMTLWRYFTDSQEHAGGFIMVKAVVGANWGDEGKGKITDMLAEKADIIIRFQGGANAGHTIINDYGKFALHTLPSGVFYGHTTSIIGNGVAVDIPVLFKEIQSIIDRDVPMPKILVSDRAQTGRKVVRIYKVWYCTVLFRQVCKDRFPDQRAF